MIQATIFTPSLRHKLAAAIHTLATMPAMLALLALPLALTTSCTTDELVSPASPTPGQQVTITASLGGGDNAMPDTRMGYVPNDDTTIGGLITTWTEGDAFNIVPYDNSTGEGTAQTFTLATDAGTNTGNFTGTAPAASNTYKIYYPKTIKTSADFYAFSYTGQVQTGNSTLTHLAVYHSANIEVSDYMTVNFTAAGALKSSCMKFALTLPAGLTNPTMVTLATEDGSARFYPTNKNDIGVSSLSLGLKDITLTEENNKLTAYMMMYAGDITLSGNIRVTVTGADNKKYYQTITVKETTTLTGGKMHSITVSNAANWVELSTTYTTTTVASTCLYTENGTTTKPGTDANPYLISSANDLKLVQDVTNGVITNATYKNKYYKLTTDITINTNPTNWTPIGTNTFNGTFDGNGHSVTGVYINTDQSEQGFFGHINGGTVKNLNVTGNITSTCKEGDVGGIAGRSRNNTYILGCSYSGSVTGTGYTAKMGGICGNVYDSYVIGCYNTSTVTSSQENMSHCGGIAGNTGSSRSYIIGCYNTGAVTGTDGTIVGGIVANNQGTVTGCCNIGSVTGTNVSDASCGGIVGNNSSDIITGCLWVKSSTTGTATVGIGEDTSAGTIPPIDNFATLNSTANIGTLNTAIDTWNRSYTATSSEYCHFKFTAGTDNNIPPTLTAKIP